MQWIPHQRNNRKSKHQRTVPRFFIINYFLLLGCLSFATVVVGQDSTATPASEPTPTLIPEVQTMRIWWPDTLYPPDDPTITSVLQGQTDAFAERMDVQIETRIKSDQEIGGLMAMLRSADTVAPAALPDVTLLRRQDLVAAQRLGIIHSLEGRFSTGVIGSLESTLSLGQISEELYGLPYMVQVLHVVYPDSTEIPANAAWDYESWFERGDSLVFPGRRTRGINDVFYLQYLASGGSLLRDGTLTFNPASLTQTLSFYEQASNEGLIDGFVLNYGSSQDYMAEFLRGELPSAVFNSSTYFRILQQMPNVGIGPIPTDEGDTITLLDGWMWVITTTNSDQRQLAIDYITDMMSAENQIEAANALLMVPSRRSVLEQSLPEGVDVAFYRTLLNNARLPLADSQGGTLARAMQEAFASVVTKEQSAEDAAEQVVNQETRN
ncbi:extracellular solute-binding protein [Phototrophicus methaneseepsis]|uniref:Extracellular solute-binding protein n=1 Tax=Phototrophicus methaneseepsis TaxID=2710758 RepID=A0A7S8E7Y1_9CHLR|nr:extracellular solute-binding protein [Phototrophicus methaneseepsis]QPC82012.1 extracellular solute-binding protein [Phototrophicus methaneseepsis]